ncbi:class I SAM-dependent methyltransferase [Halodurantibacterium flavum]|uniref:Class I SAM-dependent methyltransferase n=1 Tax=Halodurantibacterium flavum TaxID=1382802 RepID=A0ABW4S2F0_9RHOB
MTHTCSTSTAEVSDGPDYRLFLRTWAAQPLRVAAIAPSGAALARLITREIDPQDAPVLELGPGTGVFTRALIERGLDPADLTLVEFGAEFAALLRARFPEARVLHADAARIMPGALFPDATAGAAISGLGLLSMRPRTVFAILSNAFACLRPGANLYQFTYGPRCPVPRPILDRLGLKAIRIGGTFRNLPPASVYRISRRAPRRAVPLTPGHSILTDGLSDDQGARP